MHGLPGAGAVKRRPQRLADIHTGILPLRHGGSIKWGIGPVGITGSTDTLGWNVTWNTECRGLALLGHRAGGTLRRAHAGGKEHWRGITWEQSRGDVLRGAQTRREN